LKSERLKEHQRNTRLEELLLEVNGLLGQAESGAIEPFKKNRYPVILIMGAPRSGTTLLLQWLASLGYFCYPTNILSRFYGAPYLGSKIQLILTKHDFNNEIFDFNEAVPFTSKLGKTKGALAPNEFWYFWRRFFHYGDIQYLSDDELKQIDHRKFVSELAAIEAAFDQPLAMKAMIVNWNIPYITDILEKVLCVYIKREPFYNIQSLLEARLDYYGDTKGWYSFKPPEYSFLKDLNPHEQVGGQIFYTNAAVEKGLDSLAEEKILKIKYEDFCARPENVFKQITEKFRHQGLKVGWKYNGPASFEISNKIRVADNEVDDIINAYRKISNETIAL
jgi:Sulfotransferase family